MNLRNSTIKQPIALVILDGWGYAPRHENNAIAVAHTPYYDAVCRTFATSLLSASGENIGRAPDKPGNAEAGHLSMGTGRVAQTEASRIRRSVESGEFMNNAVLNRAFTKAREEGTAVHLVGLLSDGGVHSSTDNLFALLRLAKQYELKDIFIHCILDGLDVSQRTADIYVEALEIKLGDIGVGKIATLCGRFFAMDTGQNWERTARAYTMLVHGEGERAVDAVTAIHNSFLRGISDEFISPIVLEREADVPMARIATGDLVVFFNHRSDGMRQLVRSLSVQDHTSSPKPMVETVCLTEYDPAFNLPVAFRPEVERNTLARVLAEFEIPNVKVTEPARFRHLTYFFDGGTDLRQPYEEQILVPNSLNAHRIGYPECESFRITDTFLRRLDASPHGLFIANIPAAAMMAESGDFNKTVAAIQYIDTCLGGICEKVRDLDGIMMLTSTYGSCEDMLETLDGDRTGTATSNPVPFHYFDPLSQTNRLSEHGALEDIAPTILGILGIDKPVEMTGSDLREG
jgi:2,3-bisphosphoglycerate-independent phosphoglycerate mutase